MSRRPWSEESDIMQNDIRSNPGAALARVAGETATESPVVAAAAIETARTVSRREALRSGAVGGALTLAGLTLAGLPLSLMATPRRARAQATATPLQVLQFAYLLENLEAEFYKAVLGVATGPGASAQNAAFATVRGQLSSDASTLLTRIKDHEVAHVNLLAGAIADLGGTAADFDPEDFDFTGGNGAGNGPFAQATTSVAFLLAAAQSFEDLGTAAYKGQAGNLISNDALLETALRIHAVEARHAARIRHLRAVSGVSITPWIVRDISGISGVPSPGQGIVDTIYADEDRTTQLNIDVAALIPNFGGVDAATAAFDEPLDMTTVTTLVAPFVVGSNP